MKKRFNILIFIILTLLVAMTFASCSNPERYNDLDNDAFSKYVDNQKVIRAKIINIVRDKTVEEDYYGTKNTIRTLTFSAIIKNSDMKDMLIGGTQVVDSVETYKHDPVSVGDMVYLYPGYDENGEPYADFTEYSRAIPIMMFGLVFAVVIIAFSRFKGLRSLVALVITCAAIFFGFVPLLLQGYSPIILSIGISILVTIITLLIVCGFTIKTLSSTIGCILGISVAGLLVFIMQKTMKLTGLTDHSSIMLSMENLFNMNGLMFAAIIIGALGATMDVSVSIASSLEEIVAHSDGTLTKGQIIKSGMKIGGDIMGTMTNTLILAYVGSSLPMIILLTMNATQLDYTISWEIISTEFVRALAGSIGLVCVVPMTAIVSAFLYHKKKPD